jgi:hypothetical protein
MRQVSGSLSYWLYFPLALRNCHNPLLGGSGLTQPAADLALSSKGYAGQG